MVSKLQSHDSSLKCHNISCHLPRDTSVHSIHLKRSNNAVGNNSFNCLVLTSS